jgi:hypothetical protein
MIDLLPLLPFFGRFVIYVFILKNHMDLGFLRVTKVTFFKKTCKWSYICI